MMKVSVIVATYKGHYLAETLESVRRQTHDHLEVLVLDDAGEESCRRLVESLDDDRFRYVGNGDPLRPARNHRLGIALSTGDAIAILNHDDFFADDTVELLVAALDEHPEAVAAFSRARVATADGSEDPARTESAWRLWGLADLEPGLIPTWHSASVTTIAVPMGPATLTRSTVLKAIDLPARAGGMYDYWLGYHLATRGSVVHVDSARGFWREHDANLTHVRSRERTLERLYVARAIALDADLPARERVKRLASIPRILLALVRDTLVGR
jgi:glycosyltransferase involved in cell wall biosynthesis